MLVGPWVALKAKATKRRNELSGPFSLSVFPPGQKILGPVEWWQVAVRSKVTAEKGLCIVKEAVGQPGPRGAFGLVV